MTTEYVRAGGLGTAMHAHLPHRAAWLLVAGILLLLLLGGGATAASACLAAVVTFALLRRMMLRQIGGMTGDTAGALVELVEAAVIVSSVIV